MVDILLLAAHPDDVDFGMGATYLKLCEKHAVAQVILTHGEAGTHGTPVEREAEANEAAAFAGSTVEFLDFKDNHVEATVENAKKIAAVIRKYQPRIVMAPYHTNDAPHLDGRAHPDHTALGRLALMACRFAKFKNADVAGVAHCAARIVYYMVPAYMKPSFVVDVTSHIPKLKELWSKYPSQLKIRDGKIVDMLLLDRQWQGKQNGLEYAEAFIADAPLVLKADDLFQK